MDPSALLQAYNTKIFEKTTKVIEKPIEDVGVEEIHRLRVEIKKTTALCSLLHYCCDGLKQNKYNKTYRSLFKKAGKVRELQLQLFMLKKLKLENSLPAYSRSLLNSLNKRQKNFLILFNNKLIIRVGKTHRELASYFKKVKVHKVRSFLKKEVKEMRSIMNKDQLQQEELHELRRKLKEYQYTLRIFVPETKNPKTKNDFQELLGKWHDAAVMLEYLNSEISEGKIKTGENKKIMSLKRLLNKECQRLFEKVKSVAEKSDWTHSSDISLVK